MSPSTIQREDDNLAPSSLCLVMRRALVFLSVLFFVVASVRYRMFVWQEGGCLLKMDARLSLGPVLLSPNVEETAKPPPVRLHGFIIIYHR